MYRLSSIILIFLGIIPMLAQSPHGKKLRQNCAVCHNSGSWQMNYRTLKFDHDAKTDFNLEGAHEQTDCKACHETLVFNEAPSDCISCHEDVHTMSVGNDCTRCHTTENWLVDNITELHEENGFPLIGSHSNIDCLECHTSETNVRFDKIGNECINCHQNDFAGTQTPNHQAAGFSQDCVECHNPLATGWNTQIVDHDFFPLTLGHDIQDCSQCHTTGNFSDASSDCVTCHQSDYSSTTNPDHQGNGFSTNCTNCHTTNPGWSPADFSNHDYFPLTLGHDIKDCKECHTSDNYADVSPDCVTCHQDNYNATSNPNHSNVGYSTDCASCHTTNPGWTPATVNHDFFPLTLGHDIQDCKECHTTANYSDVSSDCVTCHQDNYNATSNPNHSNVGYSTDCASCHTTNPGWKPATVNHDFFPLTQGHNIQDCTECHTTANYSDTSSDCVTCHQDNYNATSNPNHSNVGYSTDCASCHTTNPGWKPATVSHDFFPLTQGHNIQDCTECHTTANYSDTSSDCVTCHQNDYNNTNDPNHQAANFPTDCVACHTTRPGWKPATFDHDGQYFPIYSGKHKDEWNACTDCHTNANSYSDFSCFKCHKKSETDKDHKGVNSYTYVSSACYQCHPDGKD